jgi:hypothetical protein
MVVVTLVVVVLVDGEEKKYLVDFNSTRITVQLYSITNRQILFA